MSEFKCSFCGEEIKFGVTIFKSLGRPVATAHLFVNPSGPHICDDCVREIKEEFKKDNS